jgi:hypothetical protein
MKQQAKAMEPTRLQHTVTQTQAGFVLSPLKSKVTAKHN